MIVLRGRGGQIITLAEYPRPWWDDLGRRLDAIAAEQDDELVEATA